MRGGKLFRKFVHEVFRCFRPRLIFFVDAKIKKKIAGTGAVENVQKSPKSEPSWRFFGHLKFSHKSFPPHSSGQSNKDFTWALFSYSHMLWWLRCSWWCPLSPRTCNPPATPMPAPNTCLTHKYWWLRCSWSRSATRSECTWSAKEQLRALAVLLSHKPLWLRCNWWRLASPRSCSLPSTPTPATNAYLMHTNWWLRCSWSCPTSFSSLKIGKGSARQLITGFPEIRSMCPYMQGSSCFNYKACNISVCSFHCWSCFWWTDLIW